MASISCIHYYHVTAICDNGPEISVTWYEGVEAIITKSFIFTGKETITQILMSQSLKKCEISRKIKKKQISHETKLR